MTVDALDTAVLLLFGPERFDPPETIPAPANRNLSSYCVPATITILSQCIFRHLANAHLIGKIRFASGSNISRIDEYAFGRYTLLK
jgi:hypothetical protein